MTNSSKYSQHKSKAVSNDGDVYHLADKHGLGDVLGRDLPEPKDMEELNEQILTIEVLIKSFRSHIRTQFSRLTRLSLPRCFAAFLVLFVMCFASTATATAGSHTVNLTPGKLGSETFSIIRESGLIVIRDLEITQQPSHGSVGYLVVSGKYTYNNTSLTGSDQFKYKYIIVKAFAPDETVNVTVNISISNTAPTSSHKSIETPEDRIYTSLENYGSDADGDALTYSIVTGPSNGTVNLLNSNTGKFTYEPNLNYVGLDQIRYKVSDGITSSENLYQFTVYESNDAPVAKSFSLRMDEDTTRIVSAAIQSNSSDTEGFNRFRWQTRNAVNGTLSSNTFFTPDQDFFGEASFQYRAQDDDNVYSNWATVTITVDPVNDLPVANPFSFTVNENSSYSFNSLLLANTSDVEGFDSFAFQYISINSGRISNRIYYPDEGFVGETSFRYRVNDGSDWSNVATVTVFVNDIPKVVNPISDTSIAEDSANRFYSLNRVFEDLKSSLTFSVTNSNQSLLSTSVSGSTLTLDFLDDQNGFAVITVTAEDSNNATVSDSFVVTVTAVNDTPVVVNPIIDITVDEDASNQSIDLDAVFSDIEGFLTYSVTNTNSSLLIASVAGSTLTLDFFDNQSGTSNITVTAQDTDNASVSNSFSITVDAVNDTPVVINPIADITVDEDADDVGIQLSNVFNDADGDSLTLGISGNTNTSLIGTSLQNNQILTLTFQPEQSGTADITLSADDGNGEQVAYTFSVTVNAVNDSPVVVNPIADVTVDEDADDVSVDITNVFEDIEGHLISLSIANNSNPSLLNANLVDSTITLSFLSDQNGTADITISADDGNGEQGSDTFTITVNPINDKPVTQDFAFSMDEDTTFNFWSVFSQNSSDIETRVNAASFRNFVNGRQAKAVFTPNENFFGEASFEIQPIDTEGLRGDWAKVTVTVNPVNDAPTVLTTINDITVDEDAGDVEIDLAAVFDDVDEDILTLRVSGNTNANLVDTSLFENQILFLSFIDNQFGSADITVSAQDADGESVSDTFAVTVNPVNDIPQVANSIPDVNVDEDSDDVVIELFNVFDDVDGLTDSLTLSVEGNTNPNVVGVSLTNSTKLTLTFLENQFGSSDITISAKDHVGETATDTFTVSVNPVNDTPIVEDISLTVKEDESVVFPLNAIDVDSENFTFTVVSAPENGIVGAAGESEFFGYNPHPNFFGSDSFTYTANDGEFESSTATVTVTVDPVNDVPSFTLFSSELSVEEDDGPQTFSTLITNIFAGPDNESNQKVVFNVSTNAPELFAQLPVIDPNGVLTFEPLNGSEGTAEIYISLSDDGGIENGGVDTSEVQTLIITVIPVDPKVILLNSNGNGVAGVSAQYNNGTSWVTLPGKTNQFGELNIPEHINGIVTFRMMYNNSSQIVEINLDTENIAVFQTVDVIVELIDSNGSYITDDTGQVDYAYQGWKSFGNTGVDGFTAKEMFPGIYAFRMTYGNSRQYKKQNIAENSVVTFQTIPVTVSLRDSVGNNLTDQAQFTYRGIQLLPLIGSTLSDGSILVELLPSTYRFRTTYDNATVELRQNVSNNSNVEFQTDRVTIALKNSDGELMTEDVVEYEYHSNGWNEIGSNNDGIISVELLPKTYNFRIKYKNTTKEVTQNTKFISDIAFETAPFTVELRDSANAFIPSEKAEGNGTAAYYSGGWNNIGETKEGKATIELLPNFYNFRMTYEYASAEEKNEADFNTVAFNTDLYEVELRDSNDELLVDADATVEYESNGVHEFGSLVNGVVKKELLTQKYNIYPFRMNYNNAQQTIRNDGYNPLLTTFNTRNILVQLIDSAGYLLEEEFKLEYNKNGWHSVGTSNSGQMSLELLPSYYQIRIEHKGVQAINYNASVQNSNRVIDFQTGQVFAVDDDAIQVKTNEWIDFYQYMELLPKRYDFRFANGTQRGFGIDAGYINEIELTW